MRVLYFFLLWGLPFFISAQTSYPAPVVQNSLRVNGRHIFTSKEVDQPAQYQVAKGFPKTLAKYLKKRLQYPKKAKKLGVKGTVYVQFVVDRQGKVSKVWVLKGIGMGCNKEAVRLIRQMPRWKPATLQGYKVASRYTLGVKFK